MPYRLNAVENIREKDSRSRQYMTWDVDRARARQCEPNVINCEEVKAVRRKKNVNLTTKGGRTRSS